MQRTKNLKKKWKKLKKLVMQNKDTLILQQTSSRTKTEPRNERKYSNSKNSKKLVKQNKHIIILIN